MTLRPLALLLLAASAAIQVPAQPPSLTAGEAYARIQKFYASAPPPNTVDTLKAGDPATPVTGIATAMFDTMDVLREAARRGDNLVISHEPTFYNHQDDTTFFTDDPVYKEKLAFIQQHHMVVYRLHDEIHSGPVDHILAGVLDSLGWQQYPHAPGPVGQHILTVPPTTLGQLVSTLQKSMHLQTMRIVGNPSQPITHVAFLEGAAGLQKQITALRLPEVDVLVAGESSEWETVEYVRDAVAQGRPKALILLGHVPSEEPGMALAAKDLAPLFPGLRVEHIPTGQSMWNPEHPTVKK
jgi:putative NIF3 family GTP cyclohydrolase 1 type 2